MSGSLKTTGLYAALSYFANIQLRIHGILNQSIRDVSWLCVDTLEDVGI